MAENGEKCPECRGIGKIDARLCEKCDGTGQILVHSHEHSHGDVVHDHPHPHPHEHLMEEAISHDHRHR